MSDLREELARRLWDVACDADPTPNPGSLEWSEEVGAALAAEMLRQMEWARRRCAGYTIVSMDTTPLTLAPDDWQAPK